MTNFALIGAAGYIAPRHLKAIHAVGGKLIAAADPKDSVGVLDQYFPTASFFTEIERFDRFLERLRREGSSDRIDYLSVCSPNYLHDAHTRLGLRVRAHVVCEKPLTITPWNIDALAELEAEYERRVYTVLQLRLLPSLRELKERIAASPPDKRPQVQLSYVTRRGPWYQISWKGDAAKSGGVAMNIGIHFFDLLLWIFGGCRRYELHLSEPTKMAGMLELEHADVTWLLSIDSDDLPAGYMDSGRPAFRSLTMDGEELEFSSGFTELHTEVYRDILAGGGYGLDDARPSVELVHNIRTSEVVVSPALAHPALARTRKGGPQVVPSWPPPEE
ncbi:MAG: Gfo/Idh/MocA family oxidoreductase [Myxococcales bacterium]|nr:Gfo/Idh/MocA family oxidoreductase [Myxococcales bacterium]